VRHRELIIGLAARHKLPAVYRNSFISRRMTSSGSAAYKELAEGRYLLNPPL
jgi:hypothetical protein